MDERTMHRIGAVSADTTFGEIIARPVEILGVIVEIIGIGLRDFAVAVEVIHRPVARFHVNVDIGRIAIHVAGEAG